MLLLRCSMPQGTVFYASQITLASGAIAWVKDRSRAHKCNARDQASLVEWYRRNPLRRGTGTLEWESEDEKSITPLVPPLGPSKPAKEPINAASASGSTSVAGAKTVPVRVAADGPRLAADSNF